MFNLIQRRWLVVQYSHGTRLCAAGIYAPVCNPIPVLHGWLPMGFEWETGHMGFKKIPVAQSPSRHHSAQDWAGIGWLHLSCTPGPLQAYIQIYLFSEPNFWHFPMITWPWWLWMKPILNDPWLVSFHTPLQRSKIDICAKAHCAATF